MTDMHENGRPISYLIRIQGMIDTTWSIWFGGFTISPQNGVTLLEGELRDQAAFTASWQKLMNWDCQSSQL